MKNQRGDATLLIVLIAATISVASIIYLSQLNVFQAVFRGDIISRNMAYYANEVVLTRAWVGYWKQQVTPADLGLFANNNGDELVDFSIPAVGSCDSVCLRVAAAYRTLRDVEDTTSRIFNPKVFIIKKTPTTAPQFPFETVYFLSGVSLKKGSANLGFENQWDAMISIDVFPTSSYNQPGILPAIQ